MKKILIYMNSMSKSGGIERVVSNLMNEWIKHYEIMLLTKDNSDNSFYFIPDKVRRYSLNQPLDLDMTNRYQRVVSVLVSLIKTRKKLKGFLRRENYDYIYTTTPMNSLEVYLANHNIRNKLVISEHASAFAVNKIYLGIKRFVYPKAMSVVVPNKMDVKIYMNWRCNVTYIPHMVTFEVKEKNKLDSKIAINVGRYTADKRQDILIRTWSKIKNKNGWKLWIIGEGEEEENLKSLITNLHLEGSVYLMSARKNIEEIYKQASLFLFTSRMEGFGMVLLEAMSFGIPCISFDCPSGPRDVIENGVNGYLIENNNNKVLLDRIEHALTLEYSELIELGKQAFFTVQAWDNGSILEQWNLLYGREN